MLSRSAISGLRSSGVVYVDRGIVVLNKPAGLVAQKDLKKPSNAFNTLLRDIQEKLDQTESLLPVHRLDKGTTGALLLARSQHMAREISRQLQKRSITKKYLALIETRKGITEKEGTISLPLLNQDGRISVSPLGKPAMTGYRLLASSPTHPVSLVSLDLITGLKHQLRAHLAHSNGLNAPILGDSFYGQGRNEHPRHLFLHASQVSMQRYQKVGPAKQFTLGIHVPLDEKFVAKCKEVNLPVHADDLLGGIFIDGFKTENNHIPTLGGEWIMS